MSISAAFSNALTGLGATARAAELVSSNVANALTEGYGARSLELSTRVTGNAGSGVRVTGVRRDVDEALIADRRLADASKGYHSNREEFLNGLEQTIGAPGSPGSLTNRVAQFEVSLIEAASRPESPARLNAVLDSAKSLTSHLKALSDHVQSARLDADQSIERQVATLNTGLKDVRDLNIKIQEAHARGQDASALKDLRQMKIDQLAPIIPLKQVPRENDMVALITSGGAILLDGNAAELEFAAVNTIVPEMTSASGGLSGLFINGRPVETAGERSLIAGGSLAGSFSVRDDLSVTAQARLDGVARDLVERFQDPSLDATRLLGDPGLFTDAGATFDPVNEIALSARLSINAAADPDQGGATWRLREGLGAAIQGDAGNASLLNHLADRLSLQRTPASGGFTGGSRTVSGLTSDFLSLTSTDRLQSETRLSFASTQQQSLRQMELSKGVDTDAEMQKLMQIEQAYAANARVISTADEMLQTLLAM
ncbi:flagellar hook-associated protein FlgK [Aliiroseovarius sp. 2305UL8-7]|uniref:flagellar hook-associated protein FlgK n=1 Tax=Aliiroseovarius conchicola TaxID=3121637 RepID=UPI0035295A8B